MLEGIFVLWFLLVFFSLAYTAYSVRLAPISWVQKLGWMLVVAYAGPFGLFFYMIACRSPGEGMHAAYTEAHWKQSINSEVHCLAGDATGIILAAIVMSFMTLSNGVELLVEYISAFMFGWFIFQAGMMKDMYKSYSEALFKTFFAETVSMNMVMVGMIPTMVILMSLIPHAHEPYHAAFWFVMGVATIIGGFTAYPINSWLVRNKLKHGCMTIEENMTPMEHEDHEHNTMGSISLSKQLLIVVGTFALLLLAAWAASSFVPITF